MRAIALMMLAGLGLGLAAATAYGQRAPQEPVIGEPAPDIYLNYDEKKDKERSKDDKFLLQELRGNIVLFVFFRSDDPSSRDALRLLSQLQGSWEKRGVAVWIISPEKKDKVEGLFKKQGGKNKERELDFDLDVTGYFAQAGGLFGLYDVPAPPRVVMIDTRGILVDSFDPLEGTLAERVEAQMKKTPPLLADPDKLEQRLTLAKSLADSKDYGKAYTIVKTINRTLNYVDHANPLVKTTNDLLKQLEDAAKKWIDEARELAKTKEQDKAFRILAQASVRFEKTPVAEAADAEISRLMADRDLKPKLNTAKENVRGELLLDEAADLLSLGQYDAALRTYLIVSVKYPDTESGRAAEEACERINNDPKVKAAIEKLRAEDEAERWLDLGDRFARVKLYAKAREQYERVGETHPDTPYAAKAKERLEKLPEEEPNDEAAPASAEPAKTAGGKKK